MNMLLLAFLVLATLALACVLYLLAKLIGYAGELEERLSRIERVGPRVPDVDAMAREMARRN